LKWLDILRSMTDLLTAIMRKVEELPDDRQEDVAQVLLSLLENDRALYRLNDAQMQEVDAAIASANAGRYASEEDVVRVLYTR
jgi:predicted transcriptional regulator